MARIAFTLIACALVVAVAATPADQEFLTKQREIVRLLNKVHEVNFYQDQATIGTEYDPLAHLDNYKHSRVVKELVKELKNGKLIKRGDIFNLFDDEHRREMILVFETLFFAKDWDTFHKTACWACDKINEGQFIYALSVATLHRVDTRSIRLPPAYETYPHLFVTSQVVYQAYSAKATCLVRCAADAFTGRPLCVGCDIKYIKFYQNEQGKNFDEPILFPSFDLIVSEFYGFLSNIVDYCKSKKVPIRLLNRNGRISLRPIYKLLVAAILIGFFLLYVSN